MKNLNDRIEEYRNTNQFRLMTGLPWIVHCKIIAPRKRTLEEKYTIAILSAHICNSSSIVIPENDSFFLINIASNRYEYFIGLGYVTRISGIIGSSLRELNVDWKSKCHLEPDIWQLPNINEINKFYELECKKNTSEVFFKVCRKTTFSSEEIQKLPPLHAARKNPNLTVEKKFYEKISLEKLNEIKNKYEFMEKYEKEQ